MIGKIWNFTLSKSYRKIYDVIVITLKDKEQYIYLFTCIIVFLFSCHIALKITFLPQKIQLMTEYLEKKNIMDKRKRDIDEQSKKIKGLAPIDTMIKEVLNTNKKKELEWVSQFKTFSSLKGHESKLLLENYISENFYQCIDTSKISGYEEKTYQLAQPIFLNEEELDNLLLKVQIISKEFPAILIRSIDWEKKKIDDEEKYEVNFSFVIRKKI